MENVKNCEIVSDNFLSRIGDIITNSKEVCYIVSPFPNTENMSKIESVIAAASKKKKNIFFVFNEVDTFTEEKYKKTIKKLMNLGFKPRFIKNMHAKIYLNENEVLLTSKNFNSPFEGNSYEIGLLIKDPVFARRIWHEVIEGQILMVDSEQELDNEQVQCVKNIETQDIAMGYCSHCGDPTPYDATFPNSKTNKKKTKIFCEKCQDIENHEYNYCHKCHKTNEEALNIIENKKRNPLSEDRPICWTCFDEEKKQQV